MWNILEQPWTLLAVATALFITVAVVRVFVDKARWLWLIPLLTALAAFALDYAFMTDREKIDKVFATAVEAFENEDCNAIEQLIAEGYKDSRHTNKGELMRNCRVVMDEPLVSKSYSSILERNISGDEAGIRTLNRILFDERSKAAQFAKIMLVEAEIELQKSPAGDWLISRIEILRVNNQPTKWSNISYRSL
jgi:hypothetical protein